jgi:nitrate reductase alpha subunit
MTKFGNRFAKVLKENDEEKEAFDLSLDDETGAEEFDVDTVADPEAAAEVADGDPAVRAATAQSEIQAAMVATLNGWIADGDAFLIKLNDSTNPDSVSYALGNAEADTLFDKMKGEQRRVTKVATDLAALNETMRGYLAQAQNPALRGV